MQFQHTFSGSAQREISLWGHTLSLNVLIPAVIVPGILFTGLALWPFFEQWVTGDKREHHLLDRPRNRPTRTAIGVASITFYGVLWLAGGNDLIATHFHLSVETLSWTLRVLAFVGPVIAFWCTKRIALGLQHRDQEKVLHGRETGIIKVSVGGKFTEVHEPLSAGERYRLTAHEVQKPLELQPDTDENGAPRPRNRSLKIRAKLSRWMFSDHVDRMDSQLMHPTRDPDSSDH
ncbi:hypothetical protein ACH4E7_42245 [Kitasatospora sp. NPDC018058]|uniref:hypothetical protein n=1 Tax=Kitasatospora sp. NPDC018058 TaxID=3364025 RepID=UPI0037C0F23A